MNASEVILRFLQAVGAVPDGPAFGPPAPTK
jgi:hypothetical protein